jgi:hypothetical protein
MTGSPSVA